MDTIKTILVSGIMSVLVATGAIVVAGNMSDKAPLDVNLGALSSPDIPSPYLSWGGVRTHQASKTLATATTTVCSIKSPNATSTLNGAWVRFITSSTTASTVTLAKSTTGFGSTTALQYVSISANAQATANITGTTTSAGIANLTFAPNTFFTVTMAGGVGTFSPTGVCKASFIEV